MLFGSWTYGVYRHTISSYVFAHHTGLLYAYTRLGFPLSSHLQRSDTQRLTLLWPLLDFFLAFAFAFSDEFLWVSYTGLHSIVLVFGFLGMASSAG
jgi:hypothetical protein